MLSYRTCQIPVYSFHHHRLYFLISSWLSTDEHCRTYVGEKVYLRCKRHHCVSYPFLSRNSSNIISVKVSWLSNQQSWGNCTTSRSLWYGISGTTIGVTFNSGVVELRFRSHASKTYKARCQGTREGCGRHPRPGKWLFDLFHHQIKLNPYS